MKNEEEKRTKTLIKAIAIIVAIVLLAGIIILNWPGKKEKHEIKEQKVSEPIQEEPKKEGRYYVGTKDDYIWLINSSLEAKRIYKIDHYYDSTYITRNGLLYVIYGSANTNYVDVIDFETGKSYKITNSDIEMGNASELEEIYYMKDSKIYYKDLKYKNESVDNSDHIYGSYLYYYDENTKSLKMKNISKEEEEETIYQYNNILYDFVIGENRVYHYGDGKIYVFGKASKQNDVLATEDVSWLNVVEYNADTFAYVDNNAVYLVEGELSNKKEIFKLEDDGRISNISKISDDVMQITIMHLGAKSGGVTWSDDKCYRYDFSTG